MLLLALRIECPFHPNTDYVEKLKDYYNRDISASTIWVLGKVRLCRDIQSS
jgi:hypothetical protein